MRARTLLGLDEDRSKPQRAHRRVALGKFTKPLRKGLSGAFENGNSGDQEIVLGDGVLKQPAAGWMSLCERDADDAMALRTLALQHREMYGRVDIR